MNSYNQRIYIYCYCYCIFFFSYFPNHHFFQPLKHDQVFYIANNNHTNRCISCNNTNIYIPQLRPIYPPAHRVLFDNYHVLLSGFQTCNIKVLSLFTTSPIYFKCDNSHVHTFVVLCTCYARTAFCLAFFLEISFPRVLLYFFVYVLSNSFLY